MPTPGVSLGAPTPIHVGLGALATLESQPVNRHCEKVAQDLKQGEICPGLATTAEALMTFILMSNRIGFG